MHSAIALSCTVGHLAQTRGDLTTLALLMPKPKICFACHEESLSVGQHKPLAKRLSLCHAFHISGIGGENCIPGFFCQRQEGPVKWLRSGLRVTIPPALNSSTGESSMGASLHEITELLQAWSHGDTQALEKLTRLIYEGSQRGDLRGTPICSLAGVRLVPPALLLQLY